MPTSFSYPSARPVAFRIDAEAVRAAAAAMLATVTPEPQRVAIKAAQLHLTGQAQLALFGGKLLITSPRSRNRYTCTRTSCTCEAAQYRRFCWHRGAAQIVRRIWDADQPVARCPHCLGPMVASRTYGGERSVCCLACQHELLGTVQALGLAAWSQPVQQKEAA